MAVQSDASAILGADQQRSGSPPLGASDAGDRRELETTGKVGHFAVPDLSTNLAHACVVSEEESRAEPSVGGGAAIFAKPGAVQRGD
jgi:hypothetical protein